LRVAEAALCEPHKTLRLRDTERGRINTTLMRLKIAVFACGNWPFYGWDEIQLAISYPALVRTNPALCNAAGQKQRPALVVDIQVGFRRHAAKPISVPIGICID